MISTGNKRLTSPTKFPNYDAKFNPSNPYNPCIKGIGVTKGDLFFPTVFNIVLDAVVREVPMKVFGLQEEHHGMGWVSGEHTIFLYVEDGCIATRNLIWVQKTLTTVVCIFKRVVLQMNLGKKKAMVCDPGLI